MRTRIRLSRTVLLVVVVVAAITVVGGTVSTQTPRFYRDDAIAREPESQSAGGAKVYEIESLYEMTHNLFITAGSEPSGTRARNINTIDEVPDSSWFTNRIRLTRDGQMAPDSLTADAIARGPIVGAPPDPSGLGAPRREAGRRAPGIPGARRTRRDLVHRAGSKGDSGGRHRGPDDRHEILLGLRL